MKKIRFQYILRVLLFLVPVFSLMLYAALFPINYMDRNNDFTIWQQAKDFSESGASYPVLIIGDSRSKAGLVPDLLSDKVYNLSIGGATSIEMYYTLLRYLEHHDPPETVFLIFAAKHVSEIDNWTHTLFYNYLDLPQLLEVYHYAKELDDPVVCGGFYQKDLLFYKLRFPTRYLLPMHSTGFIGEREANLQKYKELSASRGHRYYGTDDGNAFDSYEVYYQDFQASDLVDFYLRRILTLCRERGIHLILEQAPLNETSFDKLNPGYYQGYLQYMKTLAGEYPEFEIRQELYRYDNELFGDPNHLNEKGAGIYSQYLYQKYQSVF